MKLQCKHQVVWQTLVYLGLAVPDKQYKEQSINICYKTKKHYTRHGASVYMTILPLKHWKLLS